MNTPDIVMTIVLGSFWFTIGFMLSVRPLINNYIEMHHCECNHKRRSHVIKYKSFIFNQYYSHCNLCNYDCHKLEKYDWVWPTQDLRQKYLPEFQELEYDMENPIIHKPLSRKINIRF